jgi:hypothetical protein
MLCKNFTLSSSPESIPNDQVDNAAKGRISPVRWIVRFKNQSYLQAYSRDSNVSTIRDLSQAKLFHRRESAEEVAHLFNAESHRVVLIDGSVKLALYTPIDFLRFDYNADSASARVLAGYRGSR